MFRGLAGKKIIGASTTFKRCVLSIILSLFATYTGFFSRDGHPGIKVNLKAVQGDLFPLDKYIFFVSKQPTLIELDEIHQVYFSRVGASMGANAARTFDLRIVQKSGPEYTFTSINKEEHDAVERYLRDKKIKVKNEMVPDADILLQQAGLDDDDDDDMGSINSDSDAPKKKARAVDDDDSETDGTPFLWFLHLLLTVFPESFQASSSDAGSPSEDDSSDGGAATASDASGDRDFKKKKTKKSKGKEKEGEGEGAPKKKKKKSAPESDADDDDDKDKEKAKPKPKKPKKAKDDDAMDVDGEDKPKPKPKAKPKPKPKDTEGEPMDVDERPRPKPKAVKKPAPKETDADEPPKKKMKKAD